jgi:hypothetical protein
MSVLPSHAATRILVVARPTRDEVNMTVHYRLASHRSVADSDVETQNGRVLLEDKSTGFSNDLVESFSVMISLRSQKTFHIHSITSGENLRSV